MWDVCIASAGSSIDAVWDVHARRKNSRCARNPTSVSRRRATSACLRYVNLVTASRPASNPEFELPRLLQIEGAHLL
jgi:hypothetical protein